MTVAVIYLERHGNNPRFAKQFLKSIWNNPSGAEFDDILILKGYVDQETEECDMQNVFSIPDEKYTLASIRPILEQLSHDKFLFFHSFSKILAPDWLKIYLNAFKLIRNVGIVGATGSCENSPHIRTNAFMMDRNLFLDLMPDNMLTRDGEALFESGKDSLTNKIISRGLTPVVVDKHGRPFLDFGAKANIFRRGFQEDLLIADNRTYDYDISPQERRRWLSSLAWGNSNAVPETTIKQRADSYIGWNYS